MKRNLRCENEQNACMCAAAQRPGALWLSRAQCARSGSKPALLQDGGGPEQMKTSAKSPTAWTLHMLWHIAAARCSCYQATWTSNILIYSHVFMFQNSAHGLKHKCEPTGHICEELFPSTWLTSLGIMLAIERARCSELSQSGTFTQVWNGNSCSASWGLERFTQTKWHFAGGGEVGWGGWGVPAQRQLIKPSLKYSIMCLTWDRSEVIFGAEFLFPLSSAGRTKTKSWFWPVTDILALEHIEQGSPTGCDQSSGSVC